MDRIDKIMMLEYLTKIVANPNRWVYNEVAGKAKEDTKMANIHDRIKELRN